MIISETMGFIGGAIDISSSLPQTLRIRKLGHAMGVSLPMWLIAYASSCSWVGYGIATHSPAQWVTEFLAAILIITVLFAILHNHPRTYFILLTIPIVFIAFALIVPSGVLSTFLLVFSIKRIPQVVKSWRTWRTGNPSAVSVHACLLSLSSSGFWLAYGVLGHRSVVEITSVFGIIATSLIIGFELTSTRRSRVILTPEDPISTRD